MQGYLGNKALGPRAPGGARCTHARGILALAGVGVGVAGQARTIPRNDRQSLRLLWIPPQVHLRRPCYDFSFL